jgi:F-type H+-transporting ATPase subunit epsilon
MTAPTLYLEVLTPEKTLFSGFIRSIAFPCPDGETGVLPGHALLVSKLGAGVVDAVDENGDAVRFFCAGGFVEVAGGDIVILAHVAERDSEIDADRADRARMRAQERLASGRADIDYARANASLRRALDRLAAVRR